MQASGLGQSTKLSEKRLSLQYPSIGMTKSAPLHVASPGHTSHECPEKGFWRLNVPDKQGEHLNELLVFGTECSLR